MHEVVFSLTILYLALEVLERLLFADEVLKFVGRRHLHYDVRSCAFFHLLLFEDIADVACFDVHLQ